VVVDIRSALQWPLWRKPRLRIAVAVVILLGLAAIIVGAAATITLPKAPPRIAGSAAEVKQDLNNAWQAVAPGRVEPFSGETKISAAAVGLAAEVLVKANDKVFAGEPLIKLQDDELRARLASAQAQVAMRERARNDQHVSGREADRRHAEDAVSEAETAVFDARSSLDAAAMAQRAGNGTRADLNSARTALVRAQEQLRTRITALHEIEAGSPLPSQPEALLNVARADLAAARAALENATIRAPVAGTVLQVNIKVGEAAAPSSAQQPLLVIGDLSALRVRAELDDRDVGDIKIGQPVVIQAAAFPGREFSGKVASIAPTVERANVNARGPRDLTDVDIVEVLIDVTDPGPLLPGMKVDAYFRRNAVAKQ